MDSVTKGRQQAEGETLPDDDREQPASEQSEDHIVNGTEGIRGAEFWRKWRSLPAA